MTDNGLVKKEGWTVPTSSTIILLSSFLLTVPPILPSDNYKFHGTYTANYEWEQRSNRKLDIIQLADNETIEKTQIIHEFASRIIDEAEELDPRFARIVSENLWDLV